MLELLSIVQGRMMKIKVDLETRAGNSILEKTLHGHADDFLIRYVEI